MIITVLVSNNDDRLTQYRWSRFVLDVGQQIASSSEIVYFSGLSPGDRPHQSACWVLEANQYYCEKLRKSMSHLILEYGQECAIWIQSPGGELIGPQT